jgi:hypothetical protein
MNASNSWPAFILETWYRIYLQKNNSRNSAIRRVKPFVDKETLISILTLLFAHTSITDVKYGMCLVKHNQNDFKNCKIELL